jgi:uncharacterized membrane protein YfcA
MAPDPIIFFALFGVVAFMIGLSKGGLGGTLGALAVPLLSLIMPTAQANGLALPTQMLADVFAVWFHWKKWDGKLALLLLPGAIAGVTIGTFFIINVSPSVLKRGLGVIVLLFVLYKLFEKQILGKMKYKPQAWHGLLTGIVAGFSSALAQIGGPPVTIYLLMQDITPRVFIATSALFFFILNWIKVPYYIYAHILSWQNIVQIIWLLPVVPVGVWVGKWLADKLNKETFEYVIIALLALTAILLIVRG